MKNNKPKSIKNNILDKDVFIRTSSSSEEQIEDLYLQICDKIASYIDNKTDASFLNTPIRELRKEEFEEFLPIVMAQLIKKIFLLY